jgi:cell division protein FtsX
MVLLRQALRAVHESYRFVKTKPRSPLCSIVRLWLAYGSVLFFWLLSMNISRTTAQFSNVPSMIVVIRGNAPGMAVLGKRLAAVPGVKDVQYRLSEQIASARLDDPLPGIVPSFSVQTSSQNPDTVAMVATRIRRIDAVLDVLFSREVIERSADIVRWLRGATHGFGIIALGLVLIVLAWEMQASAEQRARGTWVMRRLGASRLFMAVPAAIVGGMNGFVAAVLALLSFVPAFEEVVNPNVIPETLTTPERVGFLLGGTILGSGTTLGVMMLTRTVRKSDRSDDSGWVSM